MAIADNRQRFMPLPDDRLPPRGQVLAYPEAVRLVNPVEPEFKGEVFQVYIYFEFEREIVSIVFESRWMISMSTHVRVEVTKFMVGFPLIHHQIPLDAG